MVFCTHNPPITKTSFSGPCQVQGKGKRCICGTKLKMILASSQFLWCNHQTIEKETTSTVKQVLMVLNLENDSAMKKDPLSFPGFKIIGFSYTVVSWHNKSQPIIAKVDFEFICQPFHPTLLTVVRFIPCCLFLQLYLSLHPLLNDLLCPNFAGSRDKRTVVAHMWISNSFLVKMSIKKITL